VKNSKDMGLSPEFVAEKGILRREKLGGKKVKDRHYKWASVVIESSNLSFFLVWKKQLQG
jgi:septin family protein